MFLAGSDEVGKNDVTQHDHISFVFGTDEAINVIYNKIGLKKIHMVELSEKKKNHVIKNLNFTKRNLMSLCVHVERQKIIQELMNSSKLKKTKTKKQLHGYFDNVLLSLVKKNIEPFCRVHNINDIRSLGVQCDSGMTNTIQFWKMRPVSGGRAHELADAVAWCNEHKRKFKGEIKKDLRQEIQIKLESILF